MNKQYCAKAGSASNEPTRDRLTSRSGETHLLCEQLRRRRADDALSGPCQKLTSYARTQGDKQQNDYEGGGPATHDRLDRHMHHFSVVMCCATPSSEVPTPR
jgi:hypothetical protein